MGPFHMARFTWPVSHGPVSHGPVSHALVDIRPIQDVFDIEALIQKNEVLHISAITVLIPNLDNVKSLLRTNTNADDAILDWSPTDHVKRTGSDITLIELIGEILTDLDTV